MIKRFFDIFAALFGLTLLSPVLIFLALLIKIESPGPVFFRQERVGKNFKLFKIYKFRSMKFEDTSRPLQLVTPGDSRITGVGEFLRRTKMDETPQLINILKGEMSFVGPRPELKIFADHYHKDFEEILKVTPGITDIASLEYKDEEALHQNSRDPEKSYVKQIMPKKIELAKEYIRRSSFWLDLKIMFRTLLKLFC